MTRIEYQAMPNERISLTTVQDRQFNGDRAVQAIQSYERQMQMANLDAMMYAQQWAIVPRLGDVGSYCLAPQIVFDARLAVTASNNRLLLLTEY